jgi:hypothetical protein
MGNLLSWGGITWQLKWRSTDLEESEGTFSELPKKEAKWIS